MNVVAGSRYARSLAIQGKDGILRLTVPSRIRGPREDDILHDVVDGDSLESLAATYYEGMVTTMPSNMLYWIIADYQDEPILDPFQVLPGGTVLRLPSRVAVAEVIGIRRA